MKKVLLALLLSTSLASAEEIKLTVDRAIGIRTGLMALDGYEKAIKDGANEKVIKESYKFDSGARWAFSKNIATLLPISEAYRAATNAVVIQLSNGKGPIQPGTREEADFAKQRDEIGKAEIVVDLVKMKPEEFKLDVNPIPPSILSFLDPIMVK